MAATQEAVEVLPPASIDASAGRMTSVILKLAWPVVIERLSLSVLSAVDIALVGRFVGEDGLAAVGLGTLMFWIPLSGALAIDVGSTAVVARDVGAGDSSRVQAGLRTAIVASLVWGLLCTVVVFALAPQLMRIMGAEEDVVPQGVEFLRAGCLGFPFLMVLYAISGSMRGMGNTWIPMIILIVINLLNASVTYVLISGSVADLGTQASGIGYAVAGIGGGLLALGVVTLGLGPAKLDLLHLFQVDRGSFDRLLHIGVPVGLEEAQFMLAFLVYTRIVATLGTDQLAAHSMALRSLELAILPGFALATAATALVSRYLGAQRPDLAELAATRTLLIGFGTLCCLAVLQFALAPYIVDIFTNNPEVQDNGTKLLRVFAFALPALGIHSTLSGALRGAGDVRFVLLTFTFTAWAVRVPIAFIAIVVLGLAVPFAWLAAVAENWVRAILVLRRFRGGRWTRLKV